MYNLLKLENNFGTATANRTYLKIHFNVPKLKIIFGVDQIELLTNSPIIKPAIKTYQIVWLINFAPLPLKDGCNLKTNVDNN